MTLLDRHGIRHALYRTWGRYEQLAHRVWCITCTGENIFKLKKNRKGTVTCIWCIAGLHSRFGSRVEN